MSKLIWDAVGEHYYGIGVSKGVLFPMNANGTYATGVAWNGLTAVNENPSGAEPNPQYADNMKYLNLISVEEYAYTIEAFGCPPEFLECDGTAEAATGVYFGQQPRKAFGFVFESKKGNDTLGSDYGKEIHLIYNSLASPTEKQHATENDSPEAPTWSWEANSTAIPVTAINAKTGKPYKPVSCITIDSTLVTKAKLDALEDLLYGTENAEPTLPSPDQVITMFTTP